MVPAGFGQDDEQLSVLSAFWMMFPDQSLIQSGTLKGVWESLAMMKY